MSDELTYSTYLRIGDLLSLQTPQSAVAGREEHDEMLFIVIHQVYELWFKQVLHELDHAVVLLDRDETTRCGHTLKRVLTIMKVMVAQMDVLETMTPLEFLSFRERLESGSGFQSAQFRELEFLLGHKRGSVLDALPADGAVRESLRRRLEAPSLWAAFCALVARRGHAIPSDVLGRDPSLSTEPNEGVQNALVEVYRHDRDAAELCERLVDLDEGLQEWRYRHVKMVERTIGTKPGTGGSSGADYLKTTLGRPVFPDLWEIRARL